MNYDLSCFSNEYSEARAKFLSVCANKNAQLEHFECPARGPYGEKLFMDVAQFGNRKAKKILIYVSGCHGPEAYTGSALQVEWAGQHNWEQLDPEVSVILIHALNPFGFAWGTRTNEDLVDVNRNFINHDQPYLTMEAYDNLHELLVPQQWGEKGSEAVSERLAVVTAKLKEAGDLDKAQHNHPDGIHFGGLSRCWSNMVASTVIRERAETAENIVLIDCHTGMGKYGQAELMSDLPDDLDNFKCAKEYFGSVLESTFTDKSIGSPISGTLSEWVYELLPKKDVLGLTLEFGTYPVEEILPTALHCHWLAARDRLSSLKSVAVRKAHIELFSPKEKNWRTEVLSQSEAVLTAALNYLDNR
jgi:hypothetical protein